MDEKRLQTLLWIGSAVLIAMLVASFTTVIRAALSAASWGALAGAPGDDSMRDRRQRQNLEGWLRRKAPPAPPVPKPTRPPRRPPSHPPAPPKPRWV